MFNVDIIKFGWANKNEKTFHFACTHVIVKRVLSSSCSQQISYKYPKGKKNNIKIHYVCKMSSRLYPVDVNNILAHK